jgi:hypothetical protein
MEDNMVNIENKVVARFRDGRILKGLTHDFSPMKDIFHLTTADEKKEFVEINLSQLKAIFFVKTFEGNKDYKGPTEAEILENLKKVPGLKLKITFSDGEIIYGSTQGYQPERKGFFIFLADREVNNCERAYIIKESTIEVKTWR